MPPRAARKAAAKKPSPRSKASPISSPAATSVEPLPPVEEDEKSPEAQALPAGAAQENDVEAEEKKPLEPEASLLEADAGPSAAADGEQEGLEEEKAEADGEQESLEEGKAAAAAVLGAATVEGGVVAGTEDMVEVDLLQEKIEDPEASLKGEGETLAAAEEMTDEDKLAEVVAEGEDNSGKSNETNSEEGSKKSIFEKETEASKDEGTEECRLKVGDAMGEEVGSGSDNDSDNDEDEDEVDPSIYMNPPMTERKRNKEFEIFVGGLGKEAVEDDLLKVFSEFGEIQSARIVKHPVTQKSKGFAFIRYATVEQAKKALAGLKDGTEIRGKRVGISASVDNVTLYLGNICKTWTKDQVLETLKGFVVEPIEEMLLPDDPKKEGNNKGFAFLEFGSHSDAMAAFQRLRKPDAIFGCNRSAKVAFAQFSMHPSEEAMLQVKSVYVEGIPLSWDEEKVKEMCKQYGEIEKVQLSRNFSKSKRKDFGFVAFTSHESALACIEGINDAELGEEDIKVKASLAKPQRKGRLAKQGVRGGFKVKENGEVLKEVDQSKVKGKAKANETGKGKALSKSKGTKGRESTKSKGKAIDGKSNTQQKNVEPSKGGKRGRKGMGTDNGARPSKKARSDFNFHRRPSIGYGSQRNARFGMVRTNDHPSPYASGYAKPATGYQLHSYAGASGSKQQRSDLEPHAGYLPAARQGQNPYGHAQRRADAYESQQRISGGMYRSQERISAGVYDNQQRIYSGEYSNQQRPIVGGYNNLQTGAGYPGAGLEAQYSIPGYSAYSGYEAGYPYSSTGGYATQGPYY